MAQLGHTDGKAAAATQSAQEIRDTMEWYALKKKQDSRVAGIDFQTFVSHKRAGVIQSQDAIQNVQSFFLQ